MEPPIKKAKPELKSLNGFLVPVSCSAELLPLNEKNAHPRDKMIAFDEGPHVYYVKGETGYTSVTAVVHENFEHFDALGVATTMVQRADFKKAARYAQYHTMAAEATTQEELVATIIKSWDDNGREQAAHGTAMHRFIELTLNGIPTPAVDCVERQHYQEYAKQQAAAGLVPYRTEWMLWDEELKITGSIDAIYYKPSMGTYHMVDWKRSKEIKWFGFKKGRGLCSHLQDCNFVHYTLQLNTYKYLLEKNYNLQIADMHIVVLHPSNESFLELPVADQQALVHKLITSRAF